VQRTVPACWISLQAKQSFIPILYNIQRLAISASWIITPWLVLSLIILGQFNSELQRFREIGVAGAEI
jgi:hypothetical protein